VELDGWNENRDEAQEKDVSSNCSVIGKSMEKL
jgi:hypothetical protein